MRILLPPDEILRCMEFSRVSAKTQQDIEFGQRDTAPRSVREIGRDSLIGKLAEVALARMLEERFKLHIDLDFGIYDRGVWDAQDAQINGWNIDVKCTREPGRWLLVEWSKLNFRQREDKLSHLYVMAVAGWDRGGDMPTGAVDLVGCVSLNRLKPDIGHTLIRRKGDPIPGTQTPLQADNYCIHKDHLVHDWDRAMRIVSTEQPPDTEGYPNPYTGQTTAEMRRINQQVRRL